MLGKIIVCLIVMIIAILISYLFGIKSLFVSVKSFWKEVKQKWEKKKQSGGVLLVNGPVLRYKKEGDKEYKEEKIKKSVFKIGSGEDNDLVLDSKMVEKKHAVIYKRFVHNRVYYEFVNYAKTNPAEYYNRHIDSKGVFEYLGVKDGVEIEQREVFYIGDIKIMISVSSQAHNPEGTERLLEKDGKNSSENTEQIKTRRYSLRIPQERENDICG